MKDLDLWGDLKLDGFDFQDPFTILKKQVDLFEKKVKDVLFIRLVRININNNTSKYTLATNFEIVAPQLDGYSYILFTVFSRAEKNYPVAIECNYLKDGEKNLANNDFDYECNNEEEFIQVLKIVLQSEEVQKIVRTLYHKSCL